MTDANKPLSPNTTQEQNGGFLENLDVRVVVFSLRDDRLQVLLSAGDSDRWQLPGSRVPFNQSLEGTATESVLRLTGLREAYLEQLYTYGEAGRGVIHPGQRLVSVVYFAIIPAGAYSPHMDKDARQTKWFPVDDLPALSMDHREVVAYALRRLRYKLEYTAVGFQLLPEQFSLSELQKTYEMILGEKLDKRNFRRRILEAGIIEETPHLRTGEGRPARLFRYQPDAVAEVKVRRLFP
jgi:8-oxo-dGTP diphosphatase